MSLTRESHVIAKFESIKMLFMAGTLVGRMSLAVPKVHREIDFDRE